ITGDINAHSPMWYSTIEDRRGEIISDIILNSKYIIINTDSPTRTTQH
ncbi:MAG: hypothetical protein GY938_05340, partial [Ketobacter sp.]|nr:hypothetical protein [Ketobacter sp.]